MMPSLTFAPDLKKLGLSDKEAAVYLATLTLGSSTVLRIARRAKVARATTYLVLDSLMRRGLIAQYAEGNKTLFVAESPRRLEHLLKDKESELEEERGELQQLMPKLLAFTQSADGRALVRYYEGLEGLKRIRAEMTMQSQPGDLWRQISPADYMKKVFGDDSFTYKAQRKAKKIQSRAIITTRSQKLKQHLLDTGESKWAERKFMDPKKYTSASGMSIYKDRVVITTFEGKAGGAVIESESVAKMMTELFDMLWVSLP